MSAETGPIGCHPGGDPGPVQKLEPQAPCVRARHCLAVPRAIRAKPWRALRLVAEKEDRQQHPDAAPGPRCRTGGAFPICKVEGAGCLRTLPPTEPEGVGVFCAQRTFGRFVSSIVFKSERALGAPWGGAGARAATRRRSDSQPRGPETGERPTTAQPGCSFALGSAGEPQKRVGREEPRRRPGDPPRANGSRAFAEVRRGSPGSDGGPGGLASAISAFGPVDASPLRTALRSKPRRRRRTGVGAGSALGPRSGALRKEKNSGL